MARMALFKRRENPQRPVSGLPGIQPSAPPPEADGLLLLEQSRSIANAEQIIGEKEIEYAIATLKKYKDGKANLENRIIEDELWYKVRHWEALRKNKKPDEQQDAEPSSAWLFNRLLNGHADAMDNYPEPIVLPREQSDEETAKQLSAILPVILERNNFEKTYSDNWWKKLKHGTAVYGVFWNPELENGLGDHDIRAIDLLNIFWEPGITDIQKSRNLFIVDLVDNDLLEQEYPKLRGKLGGNVIETAKYVYDDAVDTSNKSLVVDWYYKVRYPGGRKLLHYVKFVGKNLLYASENDPEYRETGWYAHGKYPVVFDTLFPDEGTPVGFGWVAICKDPQMYIDKLGKLILKHAALSANPRFFVSDDLGINDKELTDVSKQLIHFTGSLNDNKFRPFEVPPMNPEVRYIYEMKIEELKETSANRDVNAGGTSGGVTAAAAISALQEAGNKTSRDMIGGSYRAYGEINELIIENSRQFYDEKRYFRITGPNGAYEFIEFSNERLKDEPLPVSYPGEEIKYRRPIFDIKVKAQKRNPFSRASQNEMAKELYAMGFFNPERAQECLGALELMEFEGKDKVRALIEQGATLLNIVKQMAAQMDQMAEIIQAVTGKDMGIGGARPRRIRNVRVRAAGGGKSGGVNEEMAEAQKPMTNYQEALARRSKPDMASLINGIRTAVQP